MQIDLIAIGTVMELRRCHVVYVISDATTGQPLAVGVTRFDKFMMNVRVDGTIQLSVTDAFATEGEAVKCQHDKAKALNVAMFMAKQRRGGVKCIDTGEEFKSAAHAAHAHKVDAGALSRHLRGSTAHDTVAGRRYCYL